MQKTDVVIIDDNEGIRWVVKEMLKMEGVTSTVAGDGPEGMELIGKHNPNLVILDVNLGAMSGIDVAYRIRDNGYNTPIMFITGYAGSVNENVEKDLKIHGIMEKPFDMDEFVSTVKDAIEKAKI